MTPQAQLPQHGDEVAPGVLGGLLEEAIRAGGDF